MSDKKKLSARICSPFINLKNKLVAIYFSPSFALIRALLYLLAYPVVIVNKKLNAWAEFWHEDNKKHREAVAKELLIALGGFSNVTKVQCTAKTLIVGLVMPYIVDQDELKKFGFKYSKLDGQTLYLIFGFHCKHIFKVIKEAWNTATIEHLPPGHRRRKKIDAQILQEEKARQKQLEQERKEAAKAKKIQDKKDQKQAKIDAKIKKAEDKRLRKEEKIRLKAEKKLNKEKRKKDKAALKKTASKISSLRGHLKAKNNALTSANSALSQANNKLTSTANAANKAN